VQAISTSLGYSPGTPSPFNADGLIRGQLFSASYLSVLGDSTSSGSTLQQPNVNWPYLFASNNCWSLSNYAGAGRCLKDMQPFAWNLAYTNGGVIADVIGINDYRQTNSVLGWKQTWLGQACLMELGTNKIAATNFALMTLAGTWLNAVTPYNYLGVNGNQSTALQSTAMGPYGSGQTASCTVYGSDVIVGIWGFPNSGSCFVVQIDGTNFGDISNAPIINSLGGNANAPNAFIFTNLPPGLHSVVLTTSNTPPGSYTLWLDYVASADLARWQSPVLLAGNVIMPTNFSSGGTPQLIQQYNEALYEDVQAMCYVGFPVVLNDICSALEPLTNSAANLYNDNLHPGIYANQVEAAVFEQSANTRLVAANLTGNMPMPLMLPTSATSTAPAAIAGKGQLWVSNNGALYWVDAQGTNKLAP
jgi:hypothetical protein